MLRVFRMLRLAVTVLVVHAISKSKELDLIPQQRNGINYQYIVKYVLCKSICCVYESFEFTASSFLLGSMLKYAQVHPCP